MSPAPASTSRVKATGKLAQLAKIESKAGDRVVLPLVQAHLLEREPEFRDPKVIHASEMSAKDWCDRATWCRLRPRKEWPEPGERFNFAMESIWEEGNELHRKWQQWLRETGKLWGDWFCWKCNRTKKHSLEPDGYDAPECIGDSAYFEQHDWRYKEVGMQVGKISGHEDAAIVTEVRSPNRLVEFKSMALGSLRMDTPDLLAKHYGQWVGPGSSVPRKIYDLDGIWKGLKNPLKSWVRQANVYLWLAQELSLPFDKVSIVAEYKINQQAREWVIPYSARICEPLIERAHMIEFAAAEGTPIECPYGGCKQCKAWENVNPSFTKSGTAVSARRVRHKGSGQAGGAGPGTTRAADWRNAQATGRSHRVRRQCSDEAVPASGRVAELPDQPARVRRSR
jgi:hypothetical protein